MPLSERQTKALRMLADGKTGGQTAKALGVRPETVSRWRQLPQFKDALASAHDPDLADGDVNITFMKWRSYDVLLAALESDSDAVRVKAAGEVFRLFGTHLPTYRGSDQEPVDDSNDDS
jgi:hypothetical protein